MEVDILVREVWTGDSVIHLSGIEQSLLYLLASRAGRVVTRDEILDVIWGTDFVAESNIVDRHIRSLRIKLQNDYRRPRFIATVPGQGYRFIRTFSNAGWTARSPRSSVLVTEQPGGAAHRSDQCRVDDDPSYRGAYRTGYSQRAAPSTIALDCRKTSLPRGARP